MGLVAGISGASDIVLQFIIINIAKTSNVISFHRTLFRMDRFSHNGTYLINICFCINFFSNWPVVSEKL